MEHRQTTVRHPQSNRKVERMNRTIKETLRKLVNGARTTWQEKLPAALTAVRTAPCASTGHSPFYLYYARRPRVPLSKFLDATCDQERVLGDRLANMSQALKEARVLTLLTREHNRTRLNDKANVQDIKVVDSVIVAANEPLSLTAKWDPQYEVTRIRGTTHWLRHQPTGKEIRVHMDKLRLVDPNMGWDEVSPRPRRQTHIRRAPPVIPPLLALRQPLPVEPADRANAPVRAPHGAARRQQTAPPAENPAGQNNKRRRVDSPPGEPSHTWPRTLYDPTREPHRPHQLQTTWARAQPPARNRPLTWLRLQRGAQPRHLP